MIPEEDKIVETAQTTNALSSLVAALSKAVENANNSLITTLYDETGSFTVLTPTNEALEAF